MTKFIELAGQLVKTDAITRLSCGDMPMMDVPQHFVHLTDGGIITVSEKEYKAIKKGLPKASPTTKRKTGNA